MREIKVKTSCGPLVFLVQDGQKPAVLMIPGLARNPVQLSGWTDLLPDFDVSYVRLPGHGGAPVLPRADLALWTAAVNEALPYVFPGRRLYVVGESLGALLAMGLTADHIVAVDPFLTAPWFVRDRVQVDAMPIGLQTLVLQPQHAVLHRIVSPVLVLGGSEPTGEPRNLETMPSALTDADFARFAEHPKVRCRRVDGGHLLLTYHQDAVREVLREAFEPAAG